MAIKMAEPVDETIVVESELPEGVSRVDTPDILKDRESYVAKLKNDPEVKALTSQIDINDINSVHRFGSKPGERINNLATDILSSVMVPTNKEATEMLNKLAKILKKFDLEELKPEERKNPNFLEKLLKKVRDESDFKTRSSYGTIGLDFNKGFVILAETNQYGHLVATEILPYRFKTGSCTTNDLHHLAKYVVERAESVGKDIYIEDLDFKIKKAKTQAKKNKKYNKMIH